MDVQGPLIHTPQRAARHGEVAIEARLLGPDRAPDVVDVLCDAFFHYPVMRFVVQGEEAGYEARQRRLVQLFVMARVLRGEPLLGVEGATGLDAAAIVSRPDGGPAPDAVKALARDVWDELGEPARARYQAFVAACAPFLVDEPHLHLNMIGVRLDRRGTGLARALIDEVHAMSRRDERSVGITLSTEDPRNVPMYEHLGYRVLGTAVVGPDLTTWGFFRPDEKLVSSEPARSRPSP